MDRLMGRAVNPCVVSSSLTWAADMQDFVNKRTKILHFCIFMHLQNWQKYHFHKKVAKSGNKMVTKIEAFFLIFKGFSLF